MTFAWMLGLVGLTTATVATAREPVPGWPDTVLARTQALALLETFNADLLSHPSATLVLEKWCSDHQLAAVPRIVAVRDASEKPLPEDGRTLLGIDSHETVKYRRVKLTCGALTLSEADNWYVPSLLTPAMNQTLDNTNEPFGKVVKPLGFRRQTQSAQLLWAPLSPGWEMHASAHAAVTGTLDIPAEVLRHRAVLYTASNRAFSLVVETYSGRLFAFPAP
jgi:hypothetical protein